MTGTYHRTVLLELFSDQCLSPFGLITTLFCPSQIPSQLGIGLGQIRDCDPRGVDIFRMLGMKLVDLGVFGCDFGCGLLM